MIVEFGNDPVAVNTDDAQSVLSMFAQISDRTREAVRSNTEWGESGRRAGQYLVDLELDALCVRPLLDAGFDVLSEESGLQHSASVGDARAGARWLVVVDPLDGSTNASLGLPWFATALCLVIDGAPAISMVTNLATGERFEAVAGRGARSGGNSLSVAAPTTLGDAIIGVSGLPGHHFGWRQFRAMGAAALDICSVARGSFDGYVDMSVDAHGVWDYLASLLILQEAGGVAVDASGRDLVVLDHSARRTPVIASNAHLLDALLAGRSSSR